MAEGEGTLAHLRAFAHPLRLQIMSLLTGQSMSAAEVARELGCTQANASYHLRLLRDAGQVRVVEEASVRGGQAIRYRYAPDVRDGARHSPDDHAVVAAALAEELTRRSRLRDTAAEGHLTDAELWVAPEDFEAFRAAVHDASIALHAAARPARTPGTVRTSATISTFRMRSDA